MLLTPEMIDMMLDSFIETLIMVGIAGVIGGAIGTALRPSAFRADDPPSGHSVGEGL